VTARDSVAAVRSLVTHTGPGIKRQVSTDQANLSVAVDEQYLVKWFRDPVDRADLAVVEQLAARGFAHMPRFVGAVLDDGRVAAVVSELIVGATDGWQWYVDDVLAWIDGAASLDGLVDTAARMGAITAELHHALADGATHRGSLAAVRSQVAERRAVALEHMTGEAGDRLRARLGQIDAALAALDRYDDVAVQRVHGDLHAGQFLRAGDRLLVTDFDGDPMTASADRVELQPVERDIAALLQSLDHVGRVAAKRRPGADVEPFVVAAIDAASRAYRAAHPIDDALLWPLRVGQELHEYAYAATRLPVWGYVPDAAMCALFPDQDGSR
jgi:maltokinase